jgi:hypothetical protein
MDVGLRNTLEAQSAAFLEKHLKEYLDAHGRRAFVILGIDRWGMTRSFVDAGYETIFGDFMFGLGLPIPAPHGRPAQDAGPRCSCRWSHGCPLSGSILSGKTGRASAQWEKYFQWATVIAGDSHYITRHMPERMDGKIIVTNTTTQEDVDFFRCAGVKYLVTTTPVLDGRSFGTNAMEAALVALAGKGRPLSDAEIQELLDRLHLEPQLQQLN